ncbi:MAG: four helix bundle protein [Planctomycetota bacterium]
MTPDAMKRRTKQFALRTLRLTSSLPQTPEAQTIRRQLCRSATSVGANYRAAQRGRSTNEFKAKMGIVLEEADESGFWLELIIDAGMLPPGQVTSLRQEADEICAIVYTAVQRAGKQA